MSNYYIGAYWPDRPESASQCGARMSGCLRALASVDAVFGDVYLVTDKGEYPSVKIDDEPAFTAIYEQGRNREDAPPRRIIEKLGYSASFISRDRSPEQKWVIRSACGMYANNPGLLNRCVLSLPKSGETAERLTGCAPAISMAKAVVSAWDPQWAAVQSNEFRSLIAPTAAIPGAAMIGWMMYFSKRAGTVPDVAVHSRVEWPDLGTMLVVTEDPISVSREGHVSVAKALRESFQGAGLIPG